jgi:hypothetical protein
MSKQQSRLDSVDSRNLSSESIIYLGEKEISPKVLKNTPDTKETGTLHNGPAPFYVCFCSQSIF